MSVCSSHPVLHVFVLMCLIVMLNRLLIYVEFKIKPSTVHVDKGHPFNEFSYLLILSLLSLAL